MHRNAARFTALLVSVFATVALAAGEVSDVVKVKRPAGGEYFGLYLMNQKVGYIFTDVQLLPPGDKIESINEFVFKANVGTKVAERNHKEIHIYEAKPGGKLLSFTVEQHGDGGDQTLEGVNTPTGLRVVRKRPNFPNQVLNLPSAKESAEDADQVRVALLRNKDVNGFVVDGMDLQTYGVATTLGESLTRVISGVKTHLRKVNTLSEKEKVPVEALVTDDGEMVEINFGQSMKAVNEPEAVAKRLDQVEVFGLTRVVLPKPLPETAHQVPGRATMVMTGLPEKFQVDTYKQKYKKQGDGSVEVTLLAAFPDKGKRAKLPVKDPTKGAPYLKTSILVESDAPEIIALSKKIVGDEKDAYLAAQKINQWVYQNLTKDYGASADRATDVLRQRKGDCTEHSLLAVSLMRAAGIPARRVDGVIYMQQEDGVPAFYWHEWVEAYVGEWTQLDPTFNQTVADATHFGVGEEGNAEITPLIGQLKVTKVVE
ncbi:MAG: transglutaminase family protein [Myxococcaceae bacterium]